MQGAPVSQIRVHELAAELDVDSDRVIAFLSEVVGLRVRGRSTVLGESVAGRVRGRFRPARKSGRRVTSGGSSGSGSARTRPAGRRPAPPVSVGPVTDGESFAAVGPVAVNGEPGALLFLAPGAAVLPPPAQPEPADVQPGVRPTPATAERVPASVRGRTTSVARPAVPTPRAATESPAENDVEAFASAWERRGFSVSDRDDWVAAGLSGAESGLADQCVIAGLCPDELPKLLSGRTALQRLRGGESATSVWARLREEEQRPSPVRPRR